MGNRITSAFGAVLLLVLMGCSVTSGTRSMRPVVREAVDVPAQFEPAAGVELAASSCVSPLIDPRDGTEIVMHSSFGGEGIGDYEVPAGRYGLQKGELLRVNCQTGEVIGIVRE